MPKVELRPSKCPVCGTEGNAVELYPANFGMEAFNPEVFSARRLPDRVHYRIVRCSGCGLVRSDPAAGPETLSDLYSRSTLEYGAEIPALRATYGRYLAKASRYAGRKGALLEIGCGSGFFLEEALRMGYSEAMGVEPSAAAAEQAVPSVRAGIRVGMMGPGLFENGRFDIACMFQVLDHMPDPAALLDQVRAALRPGGLVLVLNHDVESFSSRLLGEGSPIVDIEHTFLYGVGTLTRLMESRGFSVREAGPALNSYSLNYLARLLPLPAPLKKAAAGALAASGLGRLRMTVPLGNMYLIAQRPADREPGGGS